MTTNTIQLTDEQYAALQKGESITIEPPKKKPEDHPLLWMPKYGDEYYVITATGICRWNYAKDSADVGTAKRVQRFKTKTEATKADEQRMALLEVNRQVVRLTQEQFPNWVCDWSNNKAKWYPYFNHESQTVELNCTTYTQTQFTFEYTPKLIWRQIDKNLIKLAMGI